MLGNPAQKMAYVKDVLPSSGIPFFRYPRLAMFGTWLVAHMGTAQNLTDG